LHGRATHCDANCSADEHAIAADRDAHGDSDTHIRAAHGDSATNGHADADPEHRRSGDAPATGMESDLSAWCREQ
jgi:hypothetical protein